MRPTIKEKVRPGPAIAIIDAATCIRQEAYQGDRDDHTFYYVGDDEVIHIYDDDSMMCASTGEPFYGKAIRQLGPEKAHHPCKGCHRQWTTNFCDTSMICQSCKHGHKHGYKESNDRAVYDFLDNSPSLYSVKKGV